MIKTNVLAHLKLSRLKWKNINAILYEKGTSKSELLMGISSDKIPDVCICNKAFIFLKTYSKISKV